MMCCVDWFEKGAIRKKEREDNRSIRRGTQGEHCTHSNIFLNAAWPGESAGRALVRKGLVFRRMARMLTAFRLYCLAQVSRMLMWTQAMHPCLAP